MIRCTQCEQSVSTDTPMAQWFRLSLEHLFTSDELEQSSHYDTDNYFCTDTCALRYLVGYLAREGLRSAIPGLVERALADDD